MHAYIQNNQLIKIALLILNDIGDAYWKLTDDSIADGYPKSVSRDWNGLPSKNLFYHFSYDYICSIQQPNKGERYFENSLVNY